MTFKDYFSKQADDYVRYRPHYPRELFEYLVGLVEEPETAWDCGTGNGQVAIVLANYFRRVYASDASPQQIAKALAHPGVEYFVAVAESTSLLSNSIDLITVAQAFHWFAPEYFYPEVKRVLKPQGIIALWCYDLFKMPNASENLKTTLQNFHEAINPFGPPERQLVEQQYKTISFPFSEIEAPAFLMTVEWDLDRLLGYLTTWSSTQRYLAQNGQENLDQLLEGIANSWNSEKSHQLIQWSLHLRVGKQDD